MKAPSPSLAAGQHRLMRERFATTPYRVVSSCQPPKIQGLTSTLSGSFLKLNTVIDR
jgi:hypothetical protein